MRPVVAADRFADFSVALCQLGQRGSQIAHRQPREQARGRLFDTAIWVLEQLSERFADLGHTGVRHLDIHLAGPFEDLRIGNARDLAIVIFN